MLWSFLRPLDFQILVSVGYEYAECGGGNIIWLYRSVKLEGRKSERFDIGGWTLDIHHHYDFVNSMLFRSSYLLILFLWKLKKRFLALAQYSKSSNLYTVFFNYKFTLREIRS